MKMPMPTPATVVLISFRLECMATPLSPDSSLAVKSSHNHSDTVEAIATESTNQPLNKPQVEGG